MNYPYMIAMQAFATIAVASDYIMFWMTYEMCMYLCIGVHRVAQCTLEHWY